MDDYSARRSGSVGYEILNSDGVVVAWANGYWATIIVALLNDAEERGLRLFRDMPGEAVGIANISHEGAEDSEVTAREAISHLAYNGLRVRCELPGDPSDAVRSLVEPCLADPEIGEMFADLVCRYVMRRLADDHLGLGRIEITDDSRHEDPGVRRMPREDGNPSAGS